MLDWAEMELVQKQRVGLIVFAHGSSVPEANAAVTKVAATTARRCGLTLWSQAFLDPVHPDLGAAVKVLSQKGAQKIVVVPYFLTVGMHVHKDLPQIVEKVSDIYPDITIVCSPPLDGDPLLVEILTRRVAQVLKS